MISPPKKASEETYLERELREANQALLVSSVLQHELTEQAQQSERTQRHLTEKAEQAEHALRESEERYRTLFNSMDEGYCIIEVIFDERDKPVDYRFLEVNAAFERQSGMREVVGKRMLEFVPSIEEHWLANYGHAALTGEPIRFANEYKTLNRWFDVYAFKVGKRDSRRVAVLFTDITARKQAEVATARLAAIVTSSEDAIISKDLSGVITTWNAGAEHLFGYSAAEAIGQSVTLLIPEDHRDEEPQILQRIRRGESIEHYETVRRRKDGAVLDISLTVSPLRDASGGIIGASKIARDITERKRAEQAVRASEERYRTLFDLVPVAIYSVDAAGVIQKFNRQAATLWGREPAVGDTDERFCGSFKMFRPDGSFMPHEHCPMAEVVNGAIPEVRDGEVQIERPDGSLVTVIVNIRPLKNERGEVAGAINCFYEVTELKRAERALRDADRRKDEFLAMLAHELRNPLAAISNAIHLSQTSDLGERDQAWGREMLERQMGQLGRLVDDLLDVSRITHGRINFQPELLPLDEVVSQAVEAVRPQIDRSRHQLSVAASREKLWVEGDRARLAQILLNLLTNAAKYTPAGGEIWLHVHADGGDAVVTVRDTGIGIAREMLPKVFDMFAQAEQGLARSQGGLGIGLTLVRRLVEMHGGHVTVESPGTGKGSTFTVRLPLAEPPAAAAERPPPPAAASLPSPAQPMRVLIVDDNRDAAQTLARLLKLSGHATQVAYDGQEALRVAAASPPQMALLDIGLPVMDGYELAGRLKQAHPGIYIAAISGYGQEADRQRAKQAGFDAHFLKPVKLESLLQALEERRGEK